MPALHRSSIPNATTDPVSLRPSWQVWTFLALMMCYLFYFYASHEMRLNGLILLLVPDDLAREWVGDDWSRFGLGDHFPILLAAAALLVLAYLAGRLTLDLMRVDQVLDRIETCVFGIGVGLNILSLFTLAVGLAGWLQQRWIFAAVASVILVAAGIRAKAWGWFPKRESPHRAAATAQQHSPHSGSNHSDSLAWLGRLAAWLALPFCVLIVLGGMLPPTQFDAREYHMQVPKEWFLEGRITFLPHNVYGNMPLGAELHSVLGMQFITGKDSWWWGTLVGKTVIAGFAPLTALAIYAAGRRFFSTTVGGIAAFIFISTPGIAHVSMTGLIDGASAFYAFLAIYAVLLRQRLLRDSDPRFSTNASIESAGENVAVKNAGVPTGAPSDAAPKGSTDAGLVILSGFLAGAGVACKYPAVLFLVVPLFVYLAVIQSRQIKWKTAALFTLAVFAGCGLWLGKNWAMSGNPTYPLLYRWFDGKTWTAEKDARWTKAHSPPRDAAGHAYSPGKFTESLKLISLRSDLLSPLLWPLAILAGFSVGNRKGIRFLSGLILWNLVTWWLATHRLDRFLIPLVPLAALLAGTGVTWDTSTGWRQSLAGIFIGCFIANFVFDGTKAVADNRYFVALGDLREDIPREKDHSDTRIHDAHRFLNKNVPPGHRALLVGEAQVFDLEVPILYNTCFDDCIFELLMKGKSRDQRLQILREHRISHLYFSWGELQRYRSPGNYGYSEYPTRDLVHREFVEQQRLLRRVPLDLNPNQSEVFEVVER